jgi:hypothetical protein
MSHSDLFDRADKTAVRQDRAASAAKRQSRVERVGYNVTDFSASLGIDVSTTNRWIAKGIVHAIKIAGLTIITAAERDRLLLEGASSGRGKQSRAPGGRFIKGGAVAKPVKRRARSRSLAEA